MAVEQGLGGGVDFKVLLLGNSFVGKTVFLLRFIGDEFQPSFISTVGVDYKKKPIER